ncbi:hypothetical protein ETD86_29490 [Nonomuraea turkmeniaca]|uniref:Uncharacterized protein n=1 Tax=Nonomuraea turkmeniaca TaxID=103838 RepID=A0A5S4FAA4_9ACTN|nr:hypothetical protein [Nonomuraea turkmeniaca]TMR14082.1 hypothetical protein ETD86_29490 [Nonomuraea turkmeniaca]
MTSRIGEMRARLSSLDQQKRALEDDLRREYSEALIALYHRIHEYAFESGLAARETTDGDDERVSLDDLEIAFYHPRSGELTPTEWLPAIATTVKDIDSGQQIEFKNPPSATLLIAVINDMRDTRNA